MEDNANGPVFRATKRRKVFRKRADSNASGDEPHVASTIQDPDSTASPANGTSSTAEPHEDALSLSETTRVRRPKKHGIAFSSSDPNSSRPHNNNNEETAMVVSEGQPQDVQNGRFARQTGRAVVVDDKHMSAYIDSKLAEMRSKSGAAALSTTTRSGNHTPDTQEANPLQPSFDPIEGTETAPLSPQPPTSNPQPNRSIQATTNPNTKRRQPRARRAPSPSTLARASLIDEIMRESNHTPHYTPPTTATTKTKTTTPTKEELDPDAAAAAAFKAEFLAQAEARNLSRRKPKAPAATTSGGAAAGAAAATSGPKLGGSRAARMRMREAEEAKAKK